MVKFEIRLCLDQRPPRAPRSPARGPSVPAAVLIALVCMLLTAPAATGSTDAFSIWSRIQAHILKQSLEEEDLAALPQVVADREAAARIRALHERAEGDEADRDRAYRDMYAAYVGAYPTSDVLYAFLSVGLEKMLQRDRPTLAPLGGRGRHYAWYWGHWGRALVYAYKATGERRYLDLLVSTYDGLLELRDDALGLEDDAKGRIVRSWGTSFRKREARANEITPAGLITLPVTEFLLLLREDPSAGEMYADVAPRFLAAVEQTVWEFEADFKTIARDTAGYYVNPVLDEVEALNHTHQLGAVMANLHVLTGKERYRRRAMALVEYFRACITREANDTYSWPYEPTPDHLRDQPAESFWKAQATLSLPLAAHRHGLAFTDDDMRRLAATFTKNVWRGEGPLNRFISPRRLLTVDVSPPPRDSLYISLTGWIFLDAFDPAIREMIVRYVATHPEECPKAWFGGARVGVLALTYMMATDAAERDDGRFTGADTPPSGRAGQPGR